MGQPNVLVLMCDQLRFRIPGVLQRCPHPHPEHRPPATECLRWVCINEGCWPVELPEDEFDAVESYSEAFVRAIAKEVFRPEDPSLATCQVRGGHALAGTLWEAAWRDA